MIIVVVVVVMLERPAGGVSEGGGECEEVGWDGGWTY